MIMIIIEKGCSEHFIISELCFNLKVEGPLDLQSLYMSLRRVQTFQTIILAMFLQVKYSDMQTRFTLPIKKCWQKKSKWLVISRLMRILWHSEVNPGLLIHFPVQKLQS